MQDSNENLNLKDKECQQSDQLKTGATSAGSLKDNQIDNVEGFDPFRRSVQTIRSPTSRSVSLDRSDFIGRNKEAPRGDLLSTNIDRGLEPKKREGHNELAGKKSIAEEAEEAEKVEDQNLADMEAIIKKMYDATLIQRNVAKDIKTGIADLEKKLSEVQANRQIWKLARRQIEGKCVQTETETVTQGVTIMPTAEKETQTGPPKEVTQHSEEVPKETEASTAKRPGKNTVKNNRRQLFSEVVDITSDETIATVMTPGKRPRSGESEEDSFTLGRADKRRPDTRGRASPNNTPITKDKEGEKNKNNNNQEGEKGESSQEWTEVQHRKVVRKKDHGKGKGTTQPQTQKEPSNTNRAKPIEKKEAIMLTAKEGETYASILKRMKEAVNPKDSGAEVETIRRTKKDELLVVLRKGDKSEQLIQKLKEAVGNQAEVVSATGRPQRTAATDANAKANSPPDVKLEVKDLDETITAEEVRKAIQEKIGEELSDEENPKLLKGFGGLQTAIFRLSREKARKLNLQQGERIKIGWVNCRIRERVEVKRCFKCQGYGHLARTCSGPERKNNCWKCGGENHRAKDCKEKPSCMICKGNGAKDAQHTTGSSKCPAYVEALLKERRRKNPWIHREKKKARPPTRK